MHSAHTQIWLWVLCAPYNEQVRHFFGKTMLLIRNNINCHTKWKHAWIFTTLESTAYIPCQPIHNNRAHANGAGTQSQAQGETNHQSMYTYHAVFVCFAVIPNGILDRPNTSCELKVFAENRKIQLESGQKNSKLFDHLRFIVTALTLQRSCCNERWSQTPTQYNTKYTASMCDAMRWKQEA